MANWFQRLADAIYREYDRRVRRASEITEYGVHHNHHPVVEADTHEQDEEEAEIINIPRGTTSSNQA